MRELDFMPAWYPQLIRRRMALKIQLIASGVVLLIGASAMAVLSRTASQAQTHRDLTEHQLLTTRKEVKQLDELLGLQGQLLSKRQIVAQLGLPVELTRLLSELVDCMPSSMTLSEIDVKTESRAKSIDQIASETKRKKDAPPSLSRSLEVRFVGVAPTEVDVTTFYGKLADRTFLENLRLVQSSEKRDRDHVMREFEIMFSIPLDYAPAGKGG